MSYFEKIYGIPEMSLEEEAALSASEKLTERNKIDMINKCGLIKQAIEQIEFRAKKIPMEANDCHATMVDQMADLVRKAENILWQAATYGIS